MFVAVGIFGLKRCRNFIIVSSYSQMCVFFLNDVFYLLFQGLYCISVNCMDNAEAQFTTALRVSLGHRSSRVHESSV